MKVKELIQLLNTCDPEQQVVLARDSEGNSYSPASYVDGNMIYYSESEFDGDVYDPIWFAWEADMTDKEWEQFKIDKPRCVVIGPIN